MNNWPNTRGGLGNSGIDHDETFSAVRTNELYLDEVRFPEFGPGDVNELLVKRSNDLVWQPVFSINQISMGQLSAAGQTTNMGTGDHIKFDTILYSNLPEVALDTSSTYSKVDGEDSVGRILLPPGKWLLETTISSWYLSGNVTIGWYDADTSTALGIDSIIGSVNSYFGAAVFVAVAEFSVPTKVEVRFAAGSVLAVRAGMYTIRRIE